MKNSPVTKSKYRREIKYIISLSEYTVLSSILKNILNIDANASSLTDYSVRSLYFDTINNSDYKDKQFSLSDRQKIRMRIYDTDQQWVKLERKGKKGRFIKKEVGIISKDDAVSMIEGNNDVLLKYNNPIIDSIYAEVIASNRRPVVIVDYDREAYVGKSCDLRINFDKKIAAAHSNDLFSSKLPSVTIQKDSYYVLEVKYTDFFPLEIQSILSSFNLIETTFSKYVYSRYDIL